MIAVVNVTQNWGIGLEGSLLVALPSDLRMFRRVTLGKTVVLGRKTLQTFPGGRPLAGRRNIIMSTNPDCLVEDAQVAHSLPELLEILRGLPREEIAVIGGGEIYRLLLPYCDGAWVTKTAQTLPADRFFPDLDALPNWSVAECQEPMEEKGISFRFVHYVNSSPLPL